MDRRTGLLLIACGCLPFAAAQAMTHDGIELPCPFRAATGLPCPLCGATRAFALAGRGDARFLDYNAVWVAVALLAVLAGIAALAAPRRINPPPAWALVLVAAVAWGYALVQRGPIVS
jgi:hypothetical protein